MPSSGMIPIEPCFIIPSERDSELFSDTKQEIHKEAMAQVLEQEQSLEDLG